MANVNQEVRELKEQVQNLSDIVQRKIKEKAADGLEEAADNILHFNPQDLAQMAKRAGKDVREFINEKRDQAEEVYETMEKKITTHPFQAVGIAAVGGLLLGMIMRRK